MDKLLRAIPFIIVIALNVLAEASRYKINMLSPFILMGAIVLLVNLVVVLFLKKKDYFVFGISGIALIGQSAVFLHSELGQFYIRHIIEGLYLGMLLMATVPLFLGIKPFCFSISEKKYPAVIVNSNNFLKLNNLMSVIWAGLFTLGIVFTIITYSSDAALQTIISTIIPILILVIIGIPANIYLPTYLMQNVKSEPIIFTSILEASEAMPFGLNKELSKGLNTVIQFELTGKEAGVGHLIIKDQTCIFVQEAHNAPNTIIKADSQLWLNVINNEMSGDKALINKMFEVEGDSSILLIFSDLFRPKSMQDIAKYTPREIAYNFKDFKKGNIQKIVVFDGGPRDKEHSKTSFMVDSFIKGAKNSGASVEYFKLNKYKIHYCTGCYTCWTKTPGQCIFKDDMTELRRKYREADLVVFASPLYIFNVSGQLKTFMDRLLPIMKPYMLLDKNGHTKHPDRFPEKGKQGFVVFSSGGFPEVEQNFDGLQAMFRLWDSHNENSHLMGEFFMPASEIIVQPVYEKRQETIYNACYQAGEDVINLGKIDKKYMQTVSFTGVTRTRFQKQANYFWETLDGKGNYLKDVPIFK